MERVSPLVYDGPMRLRGKLGIALGLVVAALVGLRLALPAIITSQANKRLADMGEYSAHVEGSTISLTRGALGLEGLRVVQKASKATEPLVLVRRLDISYEWVPLLHGEIIAKITAFEPVIHYVFPPKKKPEKSPQPPPAQVARAAKETAEKRRARPATVKIERFEVRGGRIELVDPQV